MGKFSSATEILTGLIGIKADDSTTKALAEQNAKAESIKASQKKAEKGYKNRALQELLLGRNSGVQRTVNRDSGSTTNVIGG